MQNNDIQSALQRLLQLADHHLSSFLNTSLPATTNTANPSINNVVELTYITDGNDQVRDFTSSEGIEDDGDVEGSTCSDSGSDTKDNDEGEKE